MRPRRRYGVAVLAAATGFLVYGAVWQLAGRQLARLLPGALAEAVGGRDAAAYAVTIGHVRLAPLLNGVRLRDLEVSLDSAAARESTEPALVRSATLGSVSVSGLRLLPLLRGEGILVSSIELEAPTVTMDFRPRNDDRLQGPDVTDTVEADAAEERFRPPDATLRTIRIRDAFIDLTRATPRGSLTSFLHDLDLDLTEIRIDSVSLANPARALTKSRITLAFDTAYHVLGDSLYFVVVTNVRADSRDSVMEIGSVRFTPTLEAAPFFGRLPERADRLGIAAGPIRVEGVDVSAYLRDEAVHVRLVDVDSLDLSVYSDIALDWGPKARPCRYHAGFSEIPIPLRVDTIRLSGARIRYSELAKGAKHRGELAFEDVDGEITNVTNDPERMTLKTPAVARLSGRLYGEGRVKAVVRYPLLSPGLDFDVEASLGPMGLVAANRFATNVTGVEVERGEVDTLRIELHSRAGKATGSVRMRYRNLGFRILDRNSGKEMAWHSVLGFLGNVAVRSDNPGSPEDEPREGRIDYTCGENDIVFFEYLLHAVISGLKRIVFIV